MESDICYLDLTQQVTASKQSMPILESLNILEDEHARKDQRDEPGLILGLLLIICQR